ncbi:hypothetical protein Scep_021402 [Stephania cephalantha]|uniref:Uncharacterized protein n=1 Tax=Stephania cephalantha TaxID=152367 RepID=A0AAP0FAZ1_9MAGN
MILISENVVFLVLTSILTKGWLPLQFVQNGPSLWSLVLSAPYTNAYVAIGFSPRAGGCLVLVFVVGWSGGDGALVIKRYYLGDTNPSQVYPDQGELPIVSNSSAIKLQSSRLYIAFQLNTTQPQSGCFTHVGRGTYFPHKAKEEMRTMRSTTVRERERLRAKDSLRESDRRCEAMIKRTDREAIGRVACRETRGNDQPFSASERGDVAKTRGRRSRARGARRETRGRRSRVSPSRGVMRGMRALISNA